MLDVARGESYYESNLENALMNHMQEFLLELGNGFTLVVRHNRLQIEDNHYGNYTTRLFHLTFVKDA